ncbi:MAG: glycosyltransferase family 2 protein [Acidimicrobiales bacterium]
MGEQEQVRPIKHEYTKEPVESVNGTTLALTVTVVVPTKNAESTLGACLQSIREQTVTCTVVVVDNGSTDATVAIARAGSDRVITTGPERSAQRNVGAAAVPSDVVGFVDADMVLPPMVVEEALVVLGQHHGAVIIPEHTVGEGYWPRVVAFERSFYEGEDSVEAARFFVRTIFEETGGFDEAMTGAEDWDLTLRTRRLTTIGRTLTPIRHIESGMTFRGYLRKKAYYAAGLRLFVQKHGRSTAMSFARRPYLRQPWRLLWPNPGLGVGLAILKICELFVVIKAARRAAPTGSERGWQP